MADEIKNAVRLRMQQAGLKESDLDKPGAHVLIADDKDRLHVLVKESTANKLGLDKLEASIEAGAKTKALEVIESPESVDLGELGTWRDFAIEGIGPSTPTGTPEIPVELHVFSAASKAEGVGAVFYTSMDLGFAIGEVLLGENLAVRPVPPGDRDGKSYVELDPKLRGLLYKLLDRWVDDTVSADTLAAALDKWRDLQSSVIESGLIGAALALGLGPSRFELPKPKIMTGGSTAGGATDAAKDDAADSAVAQDVRDYLASLDPAISVPAKGPTAAWAENAIDSLPEDAPAAVTDKLRSLYEELQHADQSALDDLFSDTLGPKDEKPAAELNKGATRYQKSRDLKLAQLTAGLEGLNVSDKDARALADLMTAALQPSPKPSVVIIAGPPHSAADRMLDLASSMTGKKPLELGREDLAEPGFPGVYGNIKGVPTQADAILSTGRLRAHRETAASHVPIVVRNLEAVGSAAIDPTERDAILNDWLERVKEMAQTGKVNTYAKESTASSEQRSVPLANTVFLMRWEGDEKEIRAFLENNPVTATLAAKVVGTGALDPAAGINYLEQKLAFRLHQQGAPKGVKVEIGSELRSALLAAYEDVGSVQGHERFFERLYEDLYDAASEAASAKYVVNWSKKLTKKDREKVTNGEPIPFATRFYSVEAG